MKIAFLLLLLAGCASTQYLAYEGQNEFVGQGGTRFSIDGIDVWQDGTPPKKFRLLGIINDARGGGIAPQSSKYADLARIAKREGGDAVMLASSNTEYAGSFNTGAANIQGNSIYASGVSVPAMKRHSKYWVVKYLN